MAIVWNTQMSQKFLNGRGWRRLWVALTVLQFAGAGYFVISRWQGQAAVEDINVIRAQNAAKVTRVEIPGEGQVAFPNTMSLEEITHFIDTHFEKDKKKIPALAQQRIVLRDREQAAAAEKSNERVRATNWRTIGHAMGLWLTSVCLLYVFGWTVGWVVAGFRRE